MSEPFEVDFVGYQSLKRALHQVSPELKKAMERDIRAPLKPIVDRTRKELLKRDPAMSGLARSGIRQKYGSGAVVKWPGSSKPGARIFTARQRGVNVLVARRLVVTGQFGAIISKAGYGPGGTSPQGKRMVATIQSRYSPMRSIYKSYDAAGGDSVVVRQVERTIKHYSNEFQRRVNSSRD
jgi:hypothetical protein